VHGDLKPENVFWDGTRATLIDFGLGRAQHAATTSADAGAGTLHYLAPELLAGGAARTASDVYAVGAILFELATGLPPFVGDEHAIRHGIALLRPAPLPALDGLEHAIRATLAKDPALRPNAAAVVARLSAPEAPATSAAAPEPAPARARASSERSTVALLAARGLDAVAIESAVRDAHGFVARLHAPCSLAVFTVYDVDDPLAAALDLAAVLVDRGARCAVHVATVALVRRPARPHVVVGATLEDVGAWWPDDSDSLHVTPAVATARDAADPTLPLVGRDALLAAALGSLGEARRERSAGVVIALGEPGSGRSRVARELARRAGDSDTLVVEVAGASPAAATRLARELGDPPATTTAALADALAATLARRPVAIVIDDAHRVDAAILGAIDAVLVRDARVPLWVAVLADPGFEALHSRWAAGAARIARCELGPLDREATAAIAATLLDNDYLPAAFVEHLHAGSRGHVKTLVDIARMAPTARTVEAGLDDTADTDWLVTRVLSALPGELAEVVALLAIAGGELDAGELDRIDERLGGGRVDTAAALAMLGERGLVKREGGGFALRPATIASAAAQRVPEARRRRIHELALELLSAREPTEPVLAECARHAFGAGAREIAAARYGDLATRAHHMHRYVDADRWYTAAIDARPAPLAELFVGRGTMRCRTFRIADALSDFDRACELARAAGDAATAARADLEAGVALDFAMRFDESWERARRASGVADPRIGTALAFARGRHAVRTGQIESAVDLLGDAAVRARELGDDDTALAAQAMLGPMLVNTGRIADAQRCIDDALAACARNGDAFHAAVILGNRSWVWIARHEIDRAIADLVGCIEAARAIGNPWLERVPTYNVAEMLFWLGREDEALHHLARARDLAPRYFANPPEEPLLAARIAIARGDRTTAARELAWMHAHCPAGSFTPHITHLIEAVAAVLAGADLAAWHELATRAERVLAGDEAAELWYLCALATRDPLAIARVRELAATWPIWRVRADRLPA